MRKRKLYLSEMLLRLSKTSQHKDIVIINDRFNIKWTYTNISQAIVDQKNHFWNNQVKSYRIYENCLEIIVII